jgi:aminotransferase
MKERTLLLHGFSKSFAMTGFRIGFACGPDWLIDAMMKIHQYCMMCAPILSQEAAIEALVNGADDVLRMREQYHKRRDFVVRRFNEIGLNCHLPRGSFYAFPSVESTGLHGLNHVRASFSTSYEKLVEATDRMESFVDCLDSENNQSAAI